jgi:glutaredoxin
MTEPDTNAKPPRRRISGLLVFAALIVAMIFASYQSTVPTIACNAAVLKTKPDVVMLGASWCSYCNQARKYFSANKVSYCEYDIETSAEGGRLYKQLDGGAIPILIIDGKKYTGFDPTAFKQLMAEREKT